MLTFGKMPIINTTDSCSFLQGNVYTLFDLSFLKDFSASEFFSFRRFSSVIFVGDLGAREDDRAFFPGLLSSWRKLQAPPFENCPFAFHCQHSPSPPSNADILFLSLNQKLLFQSFHF